MSSSVRVVVRFRPLNKTEEEVGPECCVDLTHENEVSMLGKDFASVNERVFTFDSVLRMGSDQDDVFHVVGEPTVDNVLRGYNGTVLAYGQTGSGKTHSMLGPEGGTVDFLDPRSRHYAVRGVIPRIVETLFAKLTALPAAEVSWKVHVSVFELYKENIQDLLTEGGQQEYRIREDTINGRGIYVDNLHRRTCASAEELLEAIRLGVSRRKVASTKSNETSSRSHSLTVITLEQINHVQGNTMTVSRLNLVDLAGSEKVAKTQATGERLKEAQTINLSLTLLGNVIYKLTDGKSGYIPYRNSKLTRILQDSFGGNSITTLMCHCTTSAYNKDETVSTLRFAARAKQIRNKPRVNRELTQKELQLAYAQALDKIRGLEERLQLGGAGHPSHTSRLRPSPTKSRDIDANEGECTDPSHAEAQDTIANLLIEIEDLRKEVHANQEEISTSTQQVEFYKTKASDSETAYSELQVRCRREEERFLMRMKDLQIEIDSLRAELSQSRNAIIASTPRVSLEPAPTAPRVAVHDTRDVSRQHHVPGHIGNLRRLGELGERRNIETGQSVEAGTVEAVAISASTPAEVITFVGEPAGVDTRVDTINACDSTLLTRGGTGNSIVRQNATSQHQSVAVESPDGRRNAVPLVAQGVLTVPLITEAAASTKGPGIDVGVQAQTDQSVSEALLRLTEVEHERDTLKVDSVGLERKIAEMMMTIERLGGELEALGNRDDDLRRQLDDMRQLLESKEKENGIMRQILRELNIDIEEQMALLGSEQQRNAWLKAEADKLRHQAQTLQDSQEQQEYCDMASMELMVKTEDMDAVENEVGYLSYSAITGGGVSEGTRVSCLDTLRQLSAFLGKLLETLQGRVFNTSNLESQRLGIVSDAIRLQDRVEGAQAILADMTRTGERSLVQISPVNIPIGTGGSSQTEGQWPSRVPSGALPIPPAGASTKAPQRRTSSSALSANQILRGPGRR